jgi:hypothetical protein
MSGEEEAGRRDDRLRQLQRRPVEHLLVLPSRQAEEAEAALAHLRRRLPEGEARAWRTLARARDARRTGRQEADGQEEGIMTGRRLYDILCDEVARAPNWSRDELQFPKPLKAYTELCHAEKSVYVRAANRLKGVRR